MKLEKFDYQIGNKKAKREFIALGVLCIFLVITVVLYKTFASFSSTSSYNIIAGRVAPFNEARRALVTKDISLTADDDVSCILYNDGALNISGDGKMKNFSGNDLIALMLDDYIASKVTFTNEEKTFINDNKKVMKSLFDIVTRPWNFTVQDEKIDEFLETTFTTTNELQLTVVDNDKVNMAKAILTKVKDSGFYIENLEITGNVENIGDNAFAILAATNTSDDRDSNVYKYFYNGVDYASNANAPILFNIVSLEANLDTVGSHAVSDIAATSISIDNAVTKIPNDMFAYYNDSNSNLIIPNSVTSIGINAFYSYNGQSLTLSNTLSSLGEYAFAAYNGGNIQIPDSLATFSPNVFRDFTNEITIKACASNELTAFAPNAQFNYTETNCS